MERLGLVLLLAQLVALAAYADAKTAVIPLYRSKSTLDPDAKRSAHNVVCELPSITEQTTSYSRPAQT